MGRTELRMMEEEHFRQRKQEPMARVLIEKCEVGLFDCSLEYMKERSDRKSQMKFKPRTRTAYNVCKERVFFFFPCRRHRAVEDYLIRPILQKN